MSYEPYTLDVISQHNQFKGRKLKKYNINGLETIGVWGDEPFEIVFKNNTWEKVQVKISLDGTDTLTGKEADTVANKNMWVVQAQGTLSLKAWPETNQNGAQFIFTSADKSVAVHTHGNLSSRGIIAAAVYTEGYKFSYIPYTPFIPHCPPKFDSPWWVNPNGYWEYKTYPYWGNTLTDVTFTNANSIIGNNIIGLTTGNSCSNNNVFNCSLNATSNNSLESLAAVGAGETINQNITYTAGLQQPKFETTLKIKYTWYDDLVAAVRKENAIHTASGFPGDHVMSIGNTPRKGNMPVMSQINEVLRF